ncbi:MAG: peptide chain release factor aRF-1 [Candidatus Micrarchaeota archaeon]
MGEQGKLKYELKKRLRELSAIHGSGTELISVYISPGYPIAEMSNKLKSEYGQAANIKSKQTRNNVLGALEKILQYLKMFRKPPETGIAIFAGNISKTEGRPDIQLFSLVPHEPLNIQTYRCDSAFFLEPLEGMIEAKDSYGLVVMDGREATLAILKGTLTRIVRKLNSTAHSKVHKGGQSARRYQRLVEEGIDKYYQRIGESMDAAFLNPPVKGVIVGGPGPAKENFLKTKPFNYQLKVLGSVDTGYTEEYGVEELKSKSTEIIAEQEAVKEKKLIDEFMKEAVKGGLATYGAQDVKEALLANKVDMLLVSEGLDLKRIAYVCPQCNAKEEKIAREAVDLACKCGARMKVDSELALVDELIELAEKSNTKIEMVSTETVEGSQFLAGFYGIGAILRYK